MSRPSPQTDRVVALLELLRAHPEQPMTLAELTRRLHVNKSTCVSMLASLSAAGWLLRDPVRRTYRLGPALVAIGQTAAEGFPALEFAHAAMVELSLELHAHCAALAVSADGVTVLDRVQDPRAVGDAYRVGASYPVRPPFGSAVLAWADEAAVGAWLAEVTADRHAVLRRALAATRARGFAVELAIAQVESVRDTLARMRDDDGTTNAVGPSVRAAIDELVTLLADQQDYLAVEVQPRRRYAISAVNAPVFDRAGHVTLVLSLTGFVASLLGDEVIAIGRRLVTTTDSLTAALRGAA